MDWLCPDDRQPLDSAAGLRCPACARRYGEQAFPVFGGRHDLPHSPRLEELWSLVEQRGLAAAVETYCESRDCSPDSRTSDWTFFVPLPSDGTMLEIGSGFGDDALDLHQRVRRVLAVVRHPTNARILHARFADRNAGNAEVAVVDDLTRLPLGDGSVAAIAVEEAGAAAWNLRGRRFDRVASEWRRVLAPDGAVLLGVANPFAGRLMSRLTGRSERDTLNRAVKRAAGGNHRMPRRGVVVRAMKRHGFAAPLIHAPLPSESKVQLVIPVEDRCVVRYCLEHLVRQNSLAVRAAIRLAGLSVTLGLFPYCVPYFYLLFRRDRAH